jgi:hypothetical protein
VSFNWELGVALGSGFDADGFPVAQFDGGGEAPGLESSELHHVFGFAARPRDPEVDKDGQVKPGKACNLFYAAEGDKTHGFLGYDPRFVSLLPKLKPGGAMRYSAPGSFQIFDGEDGTDTLYVPVAGGKAHVQTIGVDGNGDPYIGLEHADGMALMFLKKSAVLKNAAGNAYLEINDDGYVLNGNGKAVGGMVCGDVTAAVPVVKAPTLIALLETLAGMIDAKSGAPSTAVAAVASAAAGLPTTLFKSF